MSVGSPRGCNIDGIPFRVTGDADIGLMDRVEVTAIPTSGGNMMQHNTQPGSAEAVKLTVSPSEYVVLKGLREQGVDMPISYTEADGTSNKTVGRINIGPRQSADGSCNVDFLTSTGVWEIFSAS